MGEREEGIWSNRHITFIVSEKAYSQFLLLYLRYMWGEGLVENVKNTVIWGEWV